LLPDIDWNTATNFLKLKDIEALKKSWVPIAEKAKAARDQLARQMTPDQIAEGQRRSAAFYSEKRNAKFKFPVSLTSRRFSIGWQHRLFHHGRWLLISNYHVVKDATKVRLLTSAGLIDAKVVSVDAANDLALLKAKGKYSSLPIAASRTASLGSTMASVGFPNTGLQGFAPKLAKGEIASLSGVLLVEAGAQVAGMVAQEDPPIRPCRG